MKHIILVFLVINLFYLSSFSQTGYFPVYGEDYAFGGQVVKKANDGNIIVGFEAFSAFTSSIAKYNIEGDTVWVGFSIDLISSLGDVDIIPVPSKGYYVIQGTLIALYNEEGALVAYHKYISADLGISETPSFLSSFFDGTNFHMLIRQATEMGYYLTQIDQDLNVVSATEYDVDADYAIYKYLLANSKDYIWRGEYNDTLSTWKSVMEVRDAASGSLLFTDTLLDTQPLKLIKLSDGVLQIGRNFTDTEHNLNLWFVKRNMDGEILWNKNASLNIFPETGASLYSIYLQDLIEMPSGNLLGLVNAQISPGPGPDSTYSYLVYFSPEGDSIFRSNVFFISTGSGGFHCMMDMEQTANNQLAFTGGEEGPDKTPPFLLLTDTLGNYFRYYVSGKLYDDMNSNSTFDIGESVFKDQVISSSPAEYYAVSDENGDYNLLLGKEGDFAINSSSPAYWDITIPETYTVSLDTSMDGDTLNHRDFIYDYSTAVQDVSVSVYQSPVIPGFPAYEAMTIKNTGNQYDASGSADLHFPAILEDPAAAPAYDMISDTTISWNYDDLDPFESIIYYVDFNCDEGSEPGDIIYTIAEITPADDITENNIDTAITIVVSSYDPNHMTVSPAGTGTEGYIDISTQYLTYTIEFQNTGTAATHFVNIYDTLNYALNIETIEMISASHNYELEITAPDVLHWKFDPLFLPDSASDMLGSMGYLKFRIKIKDGAIENDVIENTAAIYFDYNPVIYTNTVRNTLTDLTAVTDIPSALKLQLYPNPVSKYLTIDFTITQNENDLLVISDIRGRKIMTQNIAANINSATIDISSLPAGVYICTLLSDQKMLAAEKFDVIK